MKSILISRVSTEEQKVAGNSLPAQSARLKNYAKSKNLELLKEFSFDETAYKVQRNEFDAILDFVLEQKEKIAVCFDKVDRLSRNVFDKRVSMLYEKALKDEIELHFVSDGQIITSQISAVEKFQFGISLGLAKYYSDAISDNVKRSIEQKLRKGEFPGKAPYGYVNIRREDDKTDIVVDVYASKVVQKAFELYASKAYSMNLLRIKLNNDYNVNWSKGYIDHVLKESFYCGIMTLKGKSYNHRYPPIISKDLFEHVQNVKASFNKKRFKFAGKPYLYRGLIRCGHCGLSVTPEKHKGHVYYHCTQYNGKHGAAWIREDAITEQLGSLFKKLKVPDEIMKSILDNLSVLHQGKMTLHNEQFNNLTSEFNSLTKMMDNLYLDKLKGRITDDKYDEIYQSLRDQKAEIDTRLAMLQEAEDNYYITSKYLLELSNRAYALFVSSEAEERRQIVKLVLSNLRVEGKELRYDAVKPFDTILNFADSTSWLAVALEVRKCYKHFN